jgi:hypothetical protein
MLEPLKCVLAKYKTMIVKMSQDNTIIFQARLNFNLLCDIKTLLALSCVLNSLIKFAQGRDVFILNLVVT